MKKFVPFLCLLAASLSAEIEEIYVKWNAVKCIGPCIDSVQTQLTNIRTISDVRINAQGGSAAMKWSPGVPFTYEPFRSAFAAAGGITINELRVRVTGDITHDSSNVYLQSSGDGTTFQLIGPLQAAPGRYIPKNIESHPLTSYLKDQLSEAENNHWPVTITGPLYLPSYMPRVLIIEDLKVTKK